MRSPRSFMARRWWVVTDLVSSAIGSRARRGRGVELRQLPLPEGPVRKLGVRDDERGLAHHPIPEADDIQVQRPRSPANARAPVAAALRFDGVEVNEQLGGLEGGFEQDHLVQVCPLWHRSEGGRLLDAGLPQQAGARQGREPRARVREMRGAISDVRAQRHVHALRLPLGHAGMVSALRDAGKAAGQLPQHRRDLLELCSASRRTSSATTANPLPCLPARAASMAAFNASRLVMSASSRIDAMNPVMRRLTCPSPWTLLEASPTNALRATSRPIASRIWWRFLLATSLAVLDACAASVPSSDTRRDTRARLSVASSPPETSPSSASTPWRIRPVDWATAAAASRIEAAARASVASCCVSVSTVSTNGRRSSVMWIAVASWFANVLMVITSLPRYTLRLWCSSSSVPIT